MFNFRFIGSWLNALEKKIIDDDWKTRLDVALDEQKKEYEAKIQEKDSQISALKNVVARRDAKITEANRKESNARAMILKAKEMTSKIDECYKEHAESVGLITNDLVNIRNELELFVKKLPAE